MRAEPSLPRHTLVFLGPRWEDALASPLAPAEHAAVSRWLAAGLPAAIRRRAPGEARGHPLAIALPPGTAPARIAFTVRPGAAAGFRAPVLLREALPSVPAAWRARLEALEGAARAAGLTLHVHGSVAWQHLSGARYLTPRSDVDLLVRPRDAGALRRALALLRREGDGEPRLDGEILLPGGAGVAWRELAARRGRVLVKGAAGVSLLAVRDALGPLAEGLG